MQAKAAFPSPDDAFGGASLGDGFPDAPTYFERPLLKAPHWGWNVVTYLFLGGIAGGLGVVAFVARPERAPERRLRATARGAALVLSAACPLLLVSHLGRPERFLNMLRIVKFKSPMSMGVWGLVLYSGAAAAGVAREAADRGLLPRSFGRLVPPLGTGVQAALGMFMSGYTGVLLSATAIPLWGAGKRHIPAASVCSSIAGACALSALLCTLQRNGGIIEKLERFETVASMAELAILLDFRRVAGAYGAPMFQGRRGRRLRAITLVRGIGIPVLLFAIGGAARLPPPIRAARTIASAALALTGGYVLRESFIEGGKASAANPHAAFTQPQ